MDADYENAADVGSKGSGSDLHIQAVIDTATTTVVTYYLLRLVTPMLLILFKPSLSKLC